MAPPPKLIWSTWPSTSPPRPTAEPTGWSPLQTRSMQASSSLDIVLGLRGTLAASEGEISFGVVGADPASLYYGEAESEAARKREQGSDYAPGTAIFVEEQGHRRCNTAEEGSADEERGDPSGEERFAPPAHPHQGGGHECCLYDDDRLLGAVERMQGFLLARVRQVEHEGEPGERRRESGGQERRAHEQPVARPQRDGGSGDQVARIGADVEPDRHRQDRKKTRGDELCQPDKGVAVSEQTVIGGLAGGDQPAKGAEGEDRPALGGHRRAELEDAEHVVEAFGTSEVPDQEYGTQNHGEEHSVTAGAGERLVFVTEDLGDGGEQVDTCPDPADPEVHRNLPGPVGVFYRRDAIVLLVTPARVGLRMMRGLDLPVALPYTVLRRLAHLSPPSP